MLGLLVTIFVFAILVWAIMRQGSGGSTAKGWSDRISASAKRGAVGGNAAIQKGRQGAANRRAQALQAMKQLQEKENRSARGSPMVRIGRMSRRAGYALSGEVFVAGIAVGVLILFVWLTGVLGLPLGQAVLASCFAGFFVPRWWLKHVISGRQKKFVGQFADALDMVVRGTKSGLPLVECLRAVASESDEPLSSEFRLVVDRMAVGSELKVCLDNMYERMPLPEISFFSVVLVVQQQAGGNLSEALNNLSSVIRARAMMKEKVKALTSESSASSVVLCGLPFVVSGLIYLSQPEYIMPLFEDPLGHTLLMVAAGLMITGIVVMRKLSDLKI